MTLPPLSTEQAITAASGVLIFLAAVWAALAAGRAGRGVRAMRREAQARWETQLRPRPEISFPAAPATSRALEIKVANDGGAATASAILAQAGDEFFAGHLRLPAHSSDISARLDSKLKAWQPSDQPVCLIFAARDIDGGWWDCRAGVRIPGDARTWLDQRLDELRLLGVVDFREPAPRHQERAGKKRH